MKAKLKLSKDELVALWQIIREVSWHCPAVTLKNIAAREILSKLMIRLSQRIPNLKHKKNSLSLSAPEAWALLSLSPDVMDHFGPYEDNMMTRIQHEIDRQITVSINLKYHQQ